MTTLQAAEEVYDEIKAEIELDRLSKIVAARRFQRNRHLDRAFY